ncbi:MAG TPA: hypothetical protein VK783_10005 [Bacteroidia bacterium]|jgi:hypothetical protein|nr:hypothetical protein [Bacteroidia bacterium]
MQNIKFNYLYRDAGNYKLFDEVIFSNPKNIPLNKIENIIKVHLMDGMYFDPQEWGIPLLEFPEYDEELDHDWHEFESIEITTEEATDYRTISQFLKQISGK